MVKAVISYLRRHVLDFFYEPESVTRGRRFLDAAVIPYGVELWAGRRHLIVEPMCLRPAWERMHERLQTRRANGCRVAAAVVL